MTKNCQVFLKNIFYCNNFVVTVISQCPVALNRSKTINFVWNSMLILYFLAAYAKSVWTRKWLHGHQNVVRFYISHLSSTYIWLKETPKLINHFKLHLLYNVVHGVYVPYIFFDKVVKASVLVVVFLFVGSAHGCWWNCKRNCVHWFYQDWVRK